MSESIRIELTDQPDPEEVRRVDAGLDAFNNAGGRLEGVERLTVLARDEAGEVVGGVLARSWGKSSDVLIIWVDESHRGTGLGRRLMERTEEEACRRGGTLIYLDTFTFQAPEFYEKLGYQEDLRIGGFPDGIEKVHFSKRLTPA